MKDSLKSERSKHILEHILHQEQVDFTDFDKQLKEIGLRLVAIDSENPCANYYLANYYLSKNNTDSAQIHYNGITNTRIIFQEIGTRQRQIIRSKEK